MVLVVGSSRLNSNDFCESYVLGHGDSLASQVFLRLEDDVGVCYSEIKYLSERERICWRRRRETSSDLKFYIHSRTAHASLCSTSLTSHLLAKGVAVQRAFAAGFDGAASIHGKNLGTRMKYIIIGERN